MSSLGKKGKIVPDFRLIFLGFLFLEDVSLLYKEIWFLYVQFMYSSTFITDINLSGQDSWDIVHSWIMKEFLPKKIGLIIIVKFESEVRIVVY